MMNRRELLASLAALGVVGIPTTATGQTRPLNILWRNAWAIVNIGDIGHVPGALALLRHYIPEATVTLWAQQDLVFGDTIAQRARFPERSVDATTVSRKVIPDLKVVYGRLDEAGRADNRDLEAAVAAAGIMVVGSGAGVNAGADLLRFHARTKKPIGIFGATTDSFNFTNFADGDASTDVQALRACRFVFTRERTSLRLMDGEDVDGPDGAAQDNPKTTVKETINRAPITVDLRGVNKAFVPDTTFAFPVRDDASADVFMKTHGLEERRFVCFLPRHRWTPNNSPTRQGESRAVYNNYYAKDDHDKLQAAITTYVRKTGNKVALVPETIYALDVLGPWLKDGLSADVTGHVVVMDRSLAARRCAVAVRPRTGGREYRESLAAAGRGRGHAVRDGAPARGLVQRRHVHRYRPRRLVRAGHQQGDRRRYRPHADGHRVRHARGPREARQGDGVRQRTSTLRDDGGETVTGAADRRNARIPGPGLQIDRKAPSAADPDLPATESLGASVATGWSLQNV